MSQIEKFWNERKQELTDLYNGTIFVNLLFHRLYDEEGRYLLDNSRHTDPIKLLRFKENDTDIIIFCYYQKDDGTCFGSKLCDYNDINQKIDHHTIETNDQCYNYFCDNCKETIMNGYHCEKCDFDLCKKCHDGDIKHEHNLVPVDKYLDINTYQYENCSEELVVDNK